MRCIGLDHHGQSEAINKKVQVIEELKAGEILNHWNENKVWEFNYVISGKDKVIG